MIREKKLRWLHKNTGATAQLIKIADNRVFTEGTIDIEIAQRVADGLNKVMYDEDWVEYANWCSNNPNPVLWKHVELIEDWHSWFKGHHPDCHWWKPNHVLHAWSLVADAESHSR